MKTDVQDILLENEYLTNQNANYRSNCQDLADFFLPRKAWINSIRSKGERTKFNFLYDDTAIGALRDAAAGTQTYLFNPTTEWFAIQFRNKQVRERDDVKQFCQDVQDWAFSRLNESNFYNVGLEWCTDLFGFGTGTYSMLENHKKFVAFTEVPVGQVNRVVDETGELSAVYRNFKLTARQAVKMWGQNAGEEANLKSKDKPFEEMDFLHYVGERHEREAGKSDSMNMPYKSVWIGKKEKNLISESGFMEMPYMSEVFYKDSNDPNGFSPAMDCFASVKLVNAIQRTFIRADMKAADPALVMPDKGFVTPLNLNPGGMNYRNAKTKADDLTTLPTGNGKLSITAQHIQMIQEGIRNRMFVDLFRSLNEVTKQMTVLETQQRISQAMSLLGPVVNRFTRSLGYMVTRLINMGARDPLSGFPEMPEGLEHEVYDLIYLSPLAKAQRQSQISEIQSFLSDVASIGQVLPRAFHNIDEDKTIQVLARVRGITPEIMRSKDDMDRMRKHEEEQQAIIQAMQLGGGAAQIAKTGAEAHRAGAQAEAVTSK